MSRTEIEVGRTGDVAAAAAVLLGDGLERHTRNGRTCARTSARSLAALLLSTSPTSSHPHSRARRRHRQAPTHQRAARTNESLIPPPTPIPVPRVLLRCSHDLKWNLMCAVCTCNNRIALAPARICMNEMSGCVMRARALAHRTFNT